MTVENILAICLGIGLAASCGFRVFVPLLMMSIASKAGYLTLAENFGWLSSWLAVTVLAIATLLEIGAYYLPWLDNLLDSVATPAAVIAGVIVSAASVTDMDPLLKWSVAVIAGGGVAGTVKAGSMGIRLTSTATTAGVANPIVSTVEWIVSLALSVLSLAIPVVAAVIAVLLVVILIRFAFRLAARFFSQPRSSP